MPVLLLARGDKDARELLKRAIEARYGHRPPAFDTLRIDFNGRANTKIGPLSTWVPVELTTQFLLPNAMRWDFVAKPVGVPLRRGTESYDGKVLRSLRGTGKPDVISEQERVDSARRRLWAIAALLLTPLGDHFVELSTVDDLVFKAKNTQIDTDVEIHLKPNFWIDFVTVTCLNPDNNRVEQLKITAQQKLIEKDDLLLPEKITMLWNDKPSVELEPQEARNNPEIPMTVFTLNAGAATE
ncbi:MAG: hypothetical protein AAFV33_19450 [Chloroflexota bacterium]